MIDSSLEGYLLDTCVASAAWDMGNPCHRQVQNSLSQIDNDYVFISCITLAEIEYGLKTAPQIDAPRQKQVREEMSAYEVRDVNKHTAVHYSDIRAKLFNIYAPHENRNRRLKYVENLCEETSGLTLGIQENDLWIVSVAVQYNFILVTRDRAGGMKRVVDAASYQSRTQYWQ